MHGGQYLKIAFVGGSFSNAASITDVKVAVLVNNTQVVSEDFSTAAAAKTWFTDNPVDLGNISTISSAGYQGVFSVGIDLTVTSSGSAAAVFGGNIVLGTGGSMAAITRPEGWAPHDGFYMLQAREFLGQHGF